MNERTDMDWIKVQESIDRGYKDYAEGRVIDFAEVREGIREKYGI